jgi:hypothetical protein
MCISVQKNKDMWNIRMLLYFNAHFLAAHSAIMIYYYHSKIQGAASYEYINIKKEVSLPHPVFKV